MDTIRISPGTTSVLKHVAVGTGVVALAYLSYRYKKWVITETEENLLKQVQWVRGQLGVKEVFMLFDDNDWSYVISRIKSELSEFKVLGLDAEWVPGENPVALLQLATHSGLVILIRLCRLQTIPQEFKAIMSDVGILKLGVGILNDGLKLHKDHGIFLQGCVDLRHLAKRQRKARIRRLGLSSLCMGFLGYHLVKHKSITCSNWEADPLSDAQIQYAASDAQAAVRIFTKILELKDSYSNIDEQSPKAVWQKVVSLCQGVVDQEYSSDLYHLCHQSLFCTVDSDTDIPEGSLSKAQVTASQSYSGRTRALNENCRVWAADGQFLYVCDSKQAQWYLDKGLGKQISEDPLTVQLLFEPSGRPQSERNYYLQDKGNVCVVCGSEEVCTRKIVVPQEYRKYFPKVMKKHARHDVLPLCTLCHHKSNLYDSSLRQHYAKKCDAPLEGLKFVTDEELKSIKSAARALLKSADKLPDSRRRSLEQILITYFGVTELDKKLLDDAAAIDTKAPNEKFTPHGQKVVEHVISHEGLLEFEQAWRQHFLDTMRPRFLYEGWSTDHGHKELQDLNEDINSALSFETFDRTTLNTAITV